MHADLLGGIMVITLDTSKTNTSVQKKLGSDSYQKNGKVLEFSSRREERKVDEDQAIAAILKRAESLKW
ncbi:hypothetical protein C3Z09_17490 [Lelliottia aquatilis]|uniref:hypothetical protein n=1 Tax=Lelliottia aquatilis TaxID=2080838 RepID=UPI000CDECB6B|nr:hypothetical protein [Lelliottia aquatilis]POZ14554.1 hypothetical protein C3Z09_17490 [Lelliottia aquatilis]